MDKIKVFRSDQVCVIFDVNFNLLTSNSRVMSLSTISLAKPNVVKKSDSIIDLITEIYVINYCDTVDLVLNPRP